MPRRTLILAVGLQRSGNHAILEWVASLFPGTAFHNDLFHDLPADAAALRALLDADAAAGAACTILSFEDSANRMSRPGVPLLDSLAPLPDWVGESCDVHRLAILRDPYNTWASRVAANARDRAFGNPLTSNPSWDLYRENWLAVAALADDPAWRLAVFNRWKDDEAYRRALCDALGGSYSEATLEAVSMRGGGSSFESVPRPSYAGMLGQWRKYVSAPFLRRLAAKPGYYVRRFVTPPRTGRQMEVETRWKTLVGRDEGAALFADTDLREATGRIFGSRAVPETDDRAA